jgi:flavodoxin I
MNNVGIFFGTDTGTTRLLAKKMAKKLDGLADKPLNVNRITVDQMLQYDFLILGTPTYGEGELPGVATKAPNGSWQEFLPQLNEADLSGKTIALYGLGNQDKYGDRFANALFDLYEVVLGRGARIVGNWDTDGYTYSASKAEVDGRFVGLVLDHVNQSLLTDERIDSWLDSIRPHMMHKATQPQSTNAA